MVTQAVASRPSSSSPERLRLKVVIRGAVQGLGFRPFVYRLAPLAGFPPRLPRKKPPLSSIQSLESAVLEPVGYRAFRIRKSGHGGDKLALVLPDIATCDQCRQEIFDPADR